MVNEDAKKIAHFLFIGGRAIQITTSSNLLDAKYEFNRFNDNLRETIN